MASLGFSGWVYVEEDSFLFQGPVKYFDTRALLGFPNHKPNMSELIAMFSLDLLCYGFRTSVKEVERKRGRILCCCFYQFNHLQLHFCCEKMRFCLSNQHLFLLKSNFRYPTIYIYSAKTVLPFSTATSTNQTHFLLDYLIQKCGLSREKANSASKTLSHIKSPENPDSVLDFLKQIGFNDTHIRDLISKLPRLLTVNVENTLKPKFLFFQELGLYGTLFAEITSKYPYFLRCSIENQLQPNISYLRSFFHTDDNIVRVIKKWPRVLNNDLQKQIMPCIEVLRKCGIPDHQISSLILRHPIFLTQGPQWIETLVTRVENFGVERGSGMFVHAVLAMGKMSETTMEAKLELLKSFGWSEQDILVAFQKAPRFMNVSEGKVRAVMRLLVGEMGVKPCEIASWPKVLYASFEKKLLPRHEVLKILKSRGLVKEGKSLLSVVSLSGERHSCCWQAIHSV